MAFANEQWLRAGLFFLPSPSPILTHQPLPWNHFLTRPNSLSVQCPNRSPRKIEYQSDDVIKMKFVKLWDLLRYSERATSKTPTRHKLAIRGKLSLRY